MMWRRRLIGFIISVLWLVPACGLAQITTKRPPVMPPVVKTPLPERVEVPAPPTPPPPDVPNRPLSAAEAAQIALCHQPNVTIAAETVVSQQGLEMQARAALLPTVSTTAGYTVAGGASFGTVSSGQTTGQVTPGVAGTGYEVSLSVRQLVYDFNHTRDLVRQQQALVRSASAGLTKSQSDTVQLVKQAFYTYVQDIHLEQVNQSNLTDQESHLEVALGRLSAGVGLPIDVVRAQTAVADAVLNLTSARNTTTVARVNLALQMGIDPRTPIEPAEGEEPGPAAKDVNSLVDLALKQRPEVVQGRNNSEAARQALAAAATNNAPTVSTFAQVLQRGTNDIRIRPSADSVGIIVQWTPFDGYLTAGMVKTARAQLAIACAQLIQTELTVTSDVSQAYVNLRTAEQRVVTANAEVANAQQAVSLAAGRYKSGVGVFLDVLDAQSSLVTASTNQVSAVLAVNQAKVALAHALGLCLLSESK